MAVPRNRLCRYAVSSGETPQTSGWSGEHGVLYKLVDHGGSACTLAGYPQVRLYEGGHALPFSYASGGGPYVTRKHPAMVTLKPGGAAWILVAKYRCDVGVLRTATLLSVRLPGISGAAFTSALTRDGHGDIPRRRHYRGPDAAICAASGPQSSQGPDRRPGKCG